MFDIKLCHFFRYGVMPLDLLKNICLHFFPISLDLKSEIT
jgi:hypothetical protein